MNPTTLTQTWIDAAQTAPPEPTPTTTTDLERERRRLIDQLVTRIEEFATSR